MIERRDFWITLLLSVVTCGIYWFYTVYKLTDGINKMAGDDGEFIDPTLAVVLYIVTCGIYPLWWYYKTGNRMQRVGTSNGILVEESGTTYLLWILVGSLLCGLGSFICQYLYLKNFNNLADAYNNSQGAAPFTAEQ